MDLPHRELCRLWPADAVRYWMMAALLCVGAGAVIYTKSVSRTGWMETTGVTWAPTPPPPSAAALWIGLELAVIALGLVLWILLALSGVRTEVTARTITLTRLVFRRTLACPEVLSAEAVTYNWYIWFLLARHDGPADLAGGRWCALRVCAFHVPWHTERRAGRGVLLRLQDGKGVVLASREPARLLAALEESGIATPREGL
jgi:hypothetical protein